MIITFYVVLLNLFLFILNKKIIQIYNIYDKKNFKNIGLVGGLYLLINILVIFNLLLYFDNSQIENFIWNKRTYFSFFLCTHIWPTSMRLNTFSVVLVIQTF